MYGVYFLTVNSKQIIKKWEKAEFEIVHSRGSHMKLKHSDGRMVIVPHPKKNMPIGTLRNIEKASKVKLR